MLARLKLRPSIVITMTGTIHHALTWADTNSAVRIRAAATAAATVQSSPTMKWYQKRPKPAIHDQMRRSVRLPG